MPTWCRVPLRRWRQQDQHLRQRRLRGAHHAQAQHSAWVERSPIASGRAALMKIVVIGGTELIGSKVVEQADPAGHEALAAAPIPASTQSLAKVLPKRSKVRRSSPIWRTLRPSKTGRPWISSRPGKNLIEAEKAAGVQLHVAPSGDWHTTVSGQRLFSRQAGAERSSRTHRSPIRCSARRSSWSSFVASPNWRPKVIRVRLSHSFIQPIAAEDVAAAVVEAALALPGERYD